MTIAVNDVVTDNDLIEHIGEESLAETTLLPKGWTDFTPARQHALDVVLEALRRRKPPIFEGDLADVTQLKTAVLYGAAEHVYMIAMNSGQPEEIHVAKAKHFGAKFKRELNGLTPDLSDGARGRIGGITLVRR